MIRYTLVLALTITVCLPGFSQGKLEKDFDTFIWYALGKIPELPGIAIAVVKDDKPLFVRGYGYADREKNLKATGDTPFYIASSTKSFMGMLSVILEQEGKLDLNVPISKYKPFKDLKNKDVFDNVSITDLLNHTSGIENDFLTFRDAYSGDKPLDVKVMLLEEATQVKSKGKVYQYDNLGYNVLDVLLEVELGLDWRELLDEKIFTPLGMKRTSAYISEAEQNNWGLAWPYMVGRDGNANRASLMKNNSMMQAAGGLITTASDAANWLLFNINNGNLNHKQVYPADWVSQTHEKLSEHSRQGQIFSDNGYGLGWNTATFKGEDVIYHFGGYTGFFSHISFMPQKNVGVAVFANEGFIGDNVSNIIATYIYDMFLEEVPEDRYAQKFEDLRNLIGRIEKGLTADFEKRKDRKWQLDQPMSNYAGKFHNKFFGTIEIKVVDTEPLVSMGSLNCTAEPFTQKNTMRVELIPGQGSVLSFSLETGQATQLKFQVQTFKRVN